MLTAEQIASMAKTEEAVVKIEAWDGGEVKVRQLTVAEGREVNKLLSSGDAIGASVRVAFYGLVEPKMSMKQLEKMAAGSGIAGINEINVAIGNIDDPNG